MDIAGGIIEIPIERHVLKILLDARAGKAGARLGERASDVVRPVQPVVQRDEIAEDHVAIHDAFGGGLRRSERGITHAKHAAERIKLVLVDGGGGRVVAHQRRSGVLALHVPVRKDG